MIETLKTGQRVRYQGNRYLRYRYHWRNVRLRSIAAFQVPDLFVGDFHEAFSGREKPRRSGCRLLVFQQDYHSH